MERRLNLIKKKPYAKRAGMIDYNVYTMSVKEKIFNVIKVMPVIYLLSYLFFKNHIFSFILSFGALLYPNFKVKKIIDKSACL